MRAERGALYVRACAIDRTCVRGRERGTFAASVAVAVAVAASCVGWLVGWLVGSWFVVVGSYKNEPTSNGSVHRVRSDVIPSLESRTHQVSQHSTLNTQPPSTSLTLPQSVQSHSHAVPQSRSPTVTVPLSHQSLCHSVSQSSPLSVGVAHALSLTQPSSSLPPSCRSLTVVGRGAATVRR